MTMAVRAAWLAAFHDGPAVLRFEPVSHHHVAVLHAWGALPHVAEWWDLGATPAETEAYVATQRASPHLAPWLVSRAGEPVAYVETYWAIDDELAAHAPVEPGDLGWHVLVGPHRWLGTGVARLVGRAVLGRLLADGAERVVCEPDVANARMLRFCEHLGFVTVAHVDLPAKRAAFLVADRDRIDTTWPAGTAEIEETSPA